MKVLSQSHHFNRWIYEQFSQWLKGDILEIGSGTGTLSEKIIEGSSPSSSIMLTDISESYVQKLERRFAESFDIKGNVHRNISVRKLDLNSRGDFEKIGHEKFDSIIAINVLEHVQDDELALQHLYHALKKNGVLFLLVPSHKNLYNIIDMNVGHYRRYSKQDLEDKIKRKRLVIRQIFYFNMIGIIGWYINGNLLKNPLISSSGLRIFDILVPLFKRIEKATGRRIGLSLICCAYKE